MTHPTLDILQRLVEDQEMTIGITLSVDGVLLTGQLVSRRRYLAAFGGLFTDMLFKGGTGSEDERRDAAKLRKNIESMNIGDDCIHVIEGRVLSGNVFAPSAADPQSCWSIQKRSIGAFMLGTMKR